jgi:hypothetical protein
MRANQHVLLEVGEAEALIFTTNPAKNSAIAAEGFLPVATPSRLAWSSMAPLKLA